MTINTLIERSSNILTENNRYLTGQNHPVDYDEITHSVSMDMDQPKISLELIRYHCTSISIRLLIAHLDLEVQNQLFKREKNQAVFLRQISE